MPTFQIKQPIGLAARLAASQKTGVELETTPKSKPQIAFLPTSAPEIKDKLGIIFDDSGSMSGTPLREAKEGVVEFLRSCIPNQTAVGIYPLNGGAIKLDTNLPYLATCVEGITVSGCTPFVSRCSRVLEGNSSLTRLIAFSDGSPDSFDTTLLVETCKSRKLSIDTFYIGGDYNEYAISFMRKLAEDTGGIFVHLKPGVSMRSALKYLAPAFRAMLTDGAFKAKVEAGTL